MKINRCDPFFSNTSYFKGQINEFAIWSAVPNANEIALLASSKVKRMPLQVQSSSLVAYWPLDDLSDGTSGVGETFVDRSGSGNDGTGFVQTGYGGTLPSKAEEVLSYP